jgi:hypothetical protein
MPSTLIRWTSKMTLQARSQVSWIRLSSPKWSNRRLKKLKIRNLKSIQLLFRLSQLLLKILFKFSHYMRRSSKWAMSNLAVLPFRFSHWLMRSNQWVIHYKRVIIPQEWIAKALMVMPLKRRLRRHSFSLSVVNLALKPRNLRPKCNLCNSKPKHLTKMTILN